MPEEDGINLWDYWRVIGKRLWLIALSCCGTVFATALVLLMTTPIYTAESTLLIERQEPQVLDIRNVRSEPPGPDEYDFYKTQYEILKSRTLAAWVIRERGLETNIFFHRNDTGAGPVANLLAEAPGWMRWVIDQGRSRWVPTLSHKDQNERPLGVEPKLVDAYLGMLEIKPVPGTRLVRIVFNTPAPELSALLANAHAHAYIRQGLRLRARANEEAQHFLEEKLGELKERVEQSEAALSRYRRDREIISLDDKENVVVERLADLNRRLTEAEAERITLEAQVQLIRNRSTDSLPAAINSPLISTLRQQLIHLEGEYASLAAQFKPGFPQLDQLKGRLEKTQSRLRQEIRRISAGIETSFLAARGRETALREKMERQKATTLGLKDAAVEYAILAREVETNRQLYDSVLQRLKETGVVAELRASNVSVIDQAELRPIPSKPRMKKSLLVSAFMGMMVGIGLAFCFDLLDNTFKTPEEVERYLCVPNLTAVPDFTRLNGRRCPPQKLPPPLALLAGVPPSGGRGGVMRADHRPSVVMEAYRTLRAAILLSEAGQPPNTILFTSSIPGEGKTVTVVNTAFTLAQMGFSVLIIDADLRRPDCHRVLKVERGHGLTEVLVGQQDPLEVVRPTMITGLSLLTAGFIPPNPAELVASKTMQETIALLREHYDYILIDAPPVVQVSDAALLSTMVSGVVLVASGRGTPKYVVREALSRLRYARAKILGVALNQVDLRRGSNSYYYGFYYS